MGDERKTESISVVEQNVLLKGNMTQKNVISRLPRRSVTYMLT